MSGLRRGLIAAACMLAVSMTSGRALAEIWVFHPWGGPSSPVPTKAYLATDVLSGDQWVSWQRTDTGACAYQQIGDSFGLWDQVNIVGGAGIDQIEVVNRTLNVCGYPVAALLPGGRLVSIQAGGGNDRIYSSGPYWVVIQGEGGDDYILSGSPNVHLTGGPGNDTIRVTATSNTTSGLVVSGDDGNDCIRITPTLASAGDSCGSGFDSWSGPPWQPSDCEQSSNQMCPLDQVE